MFALDLRHLLGWVLGLLALGACAGSSDGGAADVPAGTAESGVPATPSEANAPAASDAPPAAAGSVAMPSAGSDEVPVGTETSELPPTVAAGAEAPPPVVTCPASSLAPGDSNGTIAVGGAMREYVLHVPPGYDGTTPVPLLVDWHPLFMNASYERGASGYAAVADREGFIVAYPNGIDAAWNLGPCCTQSRDVDDLGFALALVEKLRGEACIDPKRIYAAGFSMGGGMSHFLACKAADVFAAVAPAAFDLIEEVDCAPSRPITVISFRGTNDLVVPYAGGASTPPTLYPLPPIHFLGAVGTFERWADLNACSGPPASTGSGCETYGACSDGVEVTLCTANGGGHVTGDAEIGWQTLSRHALP